MKRYKITDAVDVDKKIAKYLIIKTSYKDYANKIKFSKRKISRQNKA